MGVNDLSSPHIDGDVTVRADATGALAPPDEEVPGLGILHPVDLAPTLQLRLGHLANVYTEVLIDVPSEPRTVPPLGRPTTRHIGDTDELLGILHNGCPGGTSWHRSLGRFALDEGNRVNV